MVKISDFENQFKKRRGIQRNKGCKQGGRQSAMAGSLFGGKPWGTFRVNRLEQIHLKTVAWERTNMLSDNPPRRSSSSKESSRWNKGINGLGREHRYHVKAKRGVLKGKAYEGRRESPRGGMSFPTARRPVAYNGEWKGNKTKCGKDSTCITEINRPTINKIRSLRRIISLIKQW